MRITAKQASIHVLLFAVTLVTTTAAGVEWLYGVSVFSPGFSWSDFALGLPYSVSFLLVLTVHEFGHYFTARYHRVGVTLPYYIPMPPFSLMLGTLGAVIRLKADQITKQQHFDIGIAGPLAGFVVSLILLGYGFTHLPPPEYIFQFHPEYELYGFGYASYVYQADYMRVVGVQDILLGKNLVYLLLEKCLADPSRIPNPHEIMHYPYLFAGLLSLVFTGLNLLPIGQLDGGHILYGLLGRAWHRRVASVVFYLFLLYAGIGYLNFQAPIERLAWTVPLFFSFIYLCLINLKLSVRDTVQLTIATLLIQYIISVVFPNFQGYSGWLFFIFVVGRFVGVLHPVSIGEEPLSRGRKILGWIALGVFVLCFTPKPIEVVSYLSTQP